MARRATIFSKYDNPQTLRIAGPYEFAQRHPVHAWDPQRLEILARAYERLDYHLGVLGPSETGAMSLLATMQPDTWFQAGSQPQTRFLSTSRGLVAAVIFPALDREAGSSFEALVTRLAVTISGIRQRHPKALVVGISAWGRKHERQFMDRHEGLCDILLGSGPGSGLTSTLSTHGKTLWSRAFTKGRTVNKLTIKEFPSPDSSFHWKTGQNIGVKLVVLDQRIQDNPAMDAFLAPLDAPANPSKKHGKTTSCGQ
jgi:hypothetical protein